MPCPLPQFSPFSTPRPKTRSAARQYPENIWVYVGIFKFLKTNYIYKRQVSGAKIAFGAA
jgi:hypothetical protein